MINLEYLEMLAKAATPGPWACEHNDRLDRHFVNRMINSKLICECEEWAEKSIKGYANAAFIAAVNPAVVLELIAMCRRLHWTAATPTEPGWYWQRRDKEDTPLPVRVEDVNKLQANSQWAGPIPEPKESAS